MPANSATTTVTMSDHGTCRPVPLGARKEQQSNTNSSNALRPVNTAFAQGCRDGEMVDARDLKSRAVPAHVYWQAAAAPSLKAQLESAPALCCDHESDHRRSLSDHHRAQIRRGVRLSPAQRAARLRLLIWLYVECRLSMAAAGHMLGITKARVLFLLRQAGVASRPKRGRIENIRWMRDRGRAA